MYYAIAPTKDDIQHHGIMGMHWGTRNGPPYPLSSSKHSASEKKAGWRKSLNKKSDRKKKRKDNGEVVVQQPKKGTQEYEDQKKKALNEGAASEVLKYKGDLTNQQLQDAVNRIRLETQLSEYSAKEVSDAWSKVDKAMNRVDTVNRWATIGLNSTNTVERIYNKLFPEESKKG